MIMQAAFFKITNIIPVEDAIKYLKEAVVNSYGKKGEKVVRMNHDAIEAGVEGVVKIEIPAGWKHTIDDKKECNKDLPAFIREIVNPMNRLEGDSLPVSTFVKHNLEDGTFMAGTTAYEKEELL